MKRIYLLLTMMVVLSACGSKQTQTTGGTDTTADTATAVVQDSVAVETPSEEVDAEFEQFFDQFTFDKFVALLKNVSQEKAKDCGLSFIYEASDEGGEEGEVGTSTEVYGWGMEKGKKMDFGYELNCISDHGCYFYYQLDTSTQAALCFKNKDDADRFFEKAVAYGLVVMNDGYHIAEQKLPDGTVKVDSFRDYDIMAEITKPKYDEEFNKGYYVIHINYFA